MINQDRMDDMHLQQAIKNRVDEPQSHEGGSNGYFGFIKKEGTFDFQGGPCHGTVLNYAVSRREKVYAVVTKINRTMDREHHGCPEQSKHSVQFYDWLFNRSPFASCWLYKSAANQFERKFTAVTTKVPANLMQAALITSRNTWEYRDKVDMWAELVSKGVNENLAYFITHFISKSGDQYSTTAATSGDHTAVGRNSTILGARAYVRNTTPNALKTNYIAGKDSGRGVHALWTFPNDDKFYPHFEECLKDFLAGGVKRTNTNVFHKAKPKPPSSGICVTLNQLAKFLIEREAELLKEA